MVRGSVRTVDPSSLPLSSGKDIIMRRSKQTILCLEVHTLTLSMTSQNQRRRAPGGHFILNVIFLKINFFNETL